MSKTKINLPEKGFNDNNLNLLYLLILDHKDSIASNNVDNFNKLTAKLVELDFLNSIAYADSAEKYFIVLFNVSEYTKCVSEADKCDRNIKDYKTNINKTKELKTEIEKLIEGKIFNSEILDTYSKNVFKKFLEESSSKSEINSNMVSKFKPVIEIIRNSVISENESKVKGEENYFIIKTVEFEDGKEFKTNLTISEFQYHKDSLDFFKKSDLVTTTLIFREKKYPFFISTGVFYSTITQKIFGVSSNENGELKVVEGLTEQGEPGAALYLNYYFKIDKSFGIIPQLGIDPTKKNPFLLFGAGFAFSILDT
jgi:hypothetical protein